MNFFEEGRDHAKKIVEKDGMKKARDRLAFHLKWNREFPCHPFDKTIRRSWLEFLAGYKSFIKENKK